MESTDDESTPSKMEIYLHQFKMKYQAMLDKVTPYVGVRWVCILFCFVFYILRVYTLQGFHIISYGLGIYILNLLIGFLTPRMDPGDNEYQDDGPTLPTKHSQEFKPFIRRLPEFKFWHSCMKAIVIAIICTFFEVLDVPVFWPILVMYFVLLFSLTMKRQIKHMIKYRYIPFTYGKPHHKGKQDTGKIVGAS